MDHHQIAVEDTGLDHRVAAHFERVMLAPGQEVRRHRDGVALTLDRRDRRAGGDAAHHRHDHRATLAVLSLEQRRLRGRRLAGEPTLDHARGEAARLRGGSDRLGGRRIGHAKNFQRTGAVRQAAEEAALLQRMIRRWMPDFDLRSSASFISSKDGGTPLSCIRAWMNWSSSSCLRVSMRHLKSNAAEARPDHEKQIANRLDVPHLFRKGSLGRFGAARTLGTSKEKGGGAEAPPPLAPIRNRIRRESRPRSRRCRDR